MKLSRDRAESVRKHLIEVDGIESTRLEAQGYGPKQPIATNKTGKGRALNRRSEFVVIDRAPAPSTASPTAAPPPATATPEK